MQLKSITSVQWENPIFRRLYCSQCLILHQSCYGCSLWYCHTISFQVSCPYVRKNCSDTYLIDINKLYLIHMLQPDKQTSLDVEL